LFLKTSITSRKNGRIGKVKGKLISVLGIMPIMGSDGDGSIALFSHARGEKQIVEKLTERYRRAAGYIQRKPCHIALQTIPDLQAN
jgi:fatty acid-binding protein DegV